MGAAHEGPSDARLAPRDLSRRNRPPPAVDGTDAPKIIPYDTGLARGPPVDKRNYPLRPVAEGRSHVEPLGPDGPSSARGGYYRRRVMSVDAEPHRMGPHIEVALDKAPETPIIVR